LENNGKWVGNLSDERNQINKTTLNKGNILIKILDIAEKEHCIKTVNARDNK